MADSETQPTPPQADIVARVDFQYRWRTWAMFLLFFGFGLYSLRDGFIEYPREIAAWQSADPKLRPPKPPHEASSVLFNQVAGVLLPPVALLILAWRRHNSRGEYRLSGQTLSVPGHPPIKLDQITGLDLVRWDRKGTAIVQYADAATKPQTFSLEDMIYERDATDQIVAKIENLLTAQEKTEREAQTGAA
jgi:hypothetical protein